MFLISKMCFNSDDTGICSEFYTRDHKKRAHFVVRFVHLVLNCNSM